MSNNKEADYFGLSKVVSLILCIFPATCLILGVLTRFRQGRIIAGILRIFLTLPIVWIFDIIFMIIYQKLFSARWLFKRKVEKRRNKYDFYS